jgi:hypothetical protein
LDPEVGYPLTYAARTGDIPACTLRPVFDSTLLSYILAGPGAFGSMIFLGMTMCFLPWRCLCPVKARPPIPDDKADENLSQNDVNHNVASQISIINF